MSLPESSLTPGRAGREPRGRPALVDQFLARAADTHPMAPAVHDGHDRWTYAELADASRAAAAWLLGLGVSAGDRIVVRATPKRSLLALLYGCLQIGGVFVPVNTAIRNYQLAHVLADAEPALFVGDDPEQLDWVSQTVPVRPLAEVREAAEQPGAVPHGLSAPERSPDDLALLLYTSGSTAQPKAVACPHAAVSFAVLAVADRLRYGSDDVVFCRLPLSFDYGLYQVFLSAWAGCEVVLASATGDMRLLTDLRETGATVVPIVPSLGEMLLTLARRDRDVAPTRVRLFTNTGEHLSQRTIDQLRERFPGAGVQLMFGTTECKRITIMEPDGDLARPDSVGRVLEGTSVRIVDENGRALPLGQTGEITVRGPHLMAGYWRSHELTERAYHVDPNDGERVLHTGDFGHLDADGYLYFSGRRDHVFKRRGTRTSVLEIESAARSLTGVREVAVLPPSDRRDAVLYIVGDITPEKALSRLSKLLDPAKVPSVCRVVEALPLTANGKVARPLLNEWENERP
ncbi:class I adenylate-forming enzyme family protein [Streptomyces solisilvae]|uniref:class I adenylate-forming enzyme family protein n=1 Tax=Streptomyces malaysiensis TaxID=92644 RepID=UPI003687CF32